MHTARPANDIGAAFVPVCNSTCAKALAVGALARAWPRNIDTLIDALPVAARAQILQGAEKELSEKRSRTQREYWEGLLLAGGVLDEAMRILYENESRESRSRLTGVAVYKELLPLFVRSDVTGQVGARMVVQALRWHLLNTARLLVYVGARVDQLIVVPVGDYLDDKSTATAAPALASAGTTLLHLLAARDEYQDILEEALAATRNVDVNVLDARDETPLLVATTAGNADAVRLLLKYGASATARNGEPIVAYSMSGIRANTPRDTVERSARVVATYAQALRASVIDNQGLMPLFDPNVLLPSTRNTRRLIALAMDTEQDTIIREVARLPTIRLLDRIDAADTPLNQHPVFARLSDSLRAFVVSRAAGAPEDAPEAAMAGAPALSALQHMWNSLSVLSTAVLFPAMARTVAATTTAAATTTTTTTAAARVPPVFDPPVPRSDLRESVYRDEIDARTLLYARVAAQANAIMNALATRQESLALTLIKDSDADALNYGESRLFDGRGTVMQVIARYGDHLLLAAALYRGGDAMSVPQEPRHSLERDPPLYIGMTNHNPLVFGTLIQAYMKKRRTIGADSTLVSSAVKRSLSVYADLLRIGCTAEAHDMSLFSVLVLALGDIDNALHNERDQATERRRFVRAAFFAAIDSSYSNGMRLFLLNLGKLQVTAEMTPELLLACTAQSRVDTVRALFEDSAIRAGISLNAYKDTRDAQQGTLAHVLAQRVSADYVRNSADGQRLALYWHEVISLMRVRGVRFDVRNSDGFLPAQLVKGTSVVVEQMFRA